MPLPHWDYFLAIEADLANCARYIDFTNDDNMKAHSIEFAQLILRSCAEIDVVGRSLTDIDKGKWLALRCQFPNMASRKIAIPRYELTFIPWKSWQSNDANAKPEWWTAYENIKHDREANSTDANLKNALTAVAGLLVIVLERFEKLQIPSLTIDLAPRILDIVTSDDEGVQGASISWDYRAR